MPDTVLHIVAQHVVRSENPRTGGRVQRERSILWRYTWVANSPMRRLPPAISHMKCIFGKIRIYYFSLNRFIIRFGKYFYRSCDFVTICIILWVETKNGASNWTISHVIQQAEHEYKAAFYFTSKLIRDKIKIT